MSQLPDLAPARRERRQCRARRAPSSAPSWLTGGSGDLAGFHQLLEAAQILPNRLGRFFAEHPRDHRAELAGGSVVLETDANLRCPAVRRGLEPDRSGAGRVGVAQRAPTDELARNLADDSSIPANGGAAPRRREPMPG